MKIVVFLNGEYLYSNEFIKTITEKAFVFCADGGAKACFRYNVKPNKIIGDLDSIDKDILNYYKNEHVKIEKYPIDKDFSDFELILNLLQEDSLIINNDIFILGALGGRIDYTINNLMLLEGLPNVIVVSNNNEEVYYRENSFIIESKKGFKISFILLDDKVVNMTLKGFKYNIENQMISRKTSKLMSNEIISNKSEVIFEKGKILVVLRREK